MLLPLLRSYTARAPGRTAPPPCSAQHGVRRRCAALGPAAALEATEGSEVPASRTPRSLLPPRAQRHARPSSRDRRRHPASSPVRSPTPGTDPPLPASPRSVCQLRLRLPRCPAPGRGRGTRAAGVRGGRTGQEGTGRSALARAAEGIPARMRCGAGAGRGTL